MRYGLVESSMGQTFDFGDITIADKDSLQYGDKNIVVDKVSANEP